MEDVSDQPEPGLRGEAPSDSGGAAVPVAPRPLWTYFLTPVAVVIGACIIAGAVWYTRSDNSKPSAAVAAVTTPAASTETANSSGAPVASGQQDLITVFTSYATQVGLDTAKFTQCLGDTNSLATINKQLQRGNALGINGTPTFIINNKMIVGAQPTAVFDEVIQAELKGSPTTLDGYSDTIKQMAASTPPNFKILSARPDVSDAEWQGSPNAKVVVAEFSDFQCPFCKRFVDTTLAHIRAELGDQVGLAFLNFPLTSIHPNAGNAALVAQCAAEQGKFWPMHDLLFARQSEWESLRAN
jgi:protein-disulfide isomerase